MALKNPFKNFSLSQKLWSGTTLFALLVISVTLIMINSQGKVNTAVRNIIELDQKALSSARDIENNIGQYTASLGLYLTSESPQYLEKINQQNLKIEKAIANFKGLIEGTSLAELEELVAEVSKTSKRFHNVGKNIVTFSQDPSLRIPGIAIAQEVIGPLAYTATTALSNSLESLSAEELDDDGQKNFLALNRLLYNWSRMSSQVRAYLLFRTDETAKSVRDFLGSISKNQQALLDAEVLDLDQEDAVTNAQEMVVSIIIEFDKLNDVHSSDAWRKDAFLVRTKLSPLEKKLSILVTELVNRIQKNSNKTSSDLISTLDSQSIATVTFSSIGLVIGLLLMGAIIHLVKTRVRNTVAALQDVSDSGNLTHQLEENGHDEISQLAIHFNRFVTKIKGVVDLVILSSSSLASESSRMNEATLKSQQQVTQQQADIEDIASAVHEMSTSSEQVKNSADAAANAASEANDHAQKGLQEVQGVVGAIHELATEVNSAANVIKILEEDSEQIGVVLSVIRSISEQTNLLALNAAIEAARAGEHGRGFAVVADEVRNLSEKIHNETDEIQNIISKLQLNSRDAVEVMGKGTARSQEVAEQAESAGLSLEKIGLSVATINDMNLNIATLSGDQNQRVDAVELKTNSIRQIANAAAETAVEATASSKEFTIMAGQLQGLVQQFLNEDEKTHHLNQASASNTQQSHTAESADDDGDVELF